MNQTLTANTGRVVAAYGNRGKLLLADGTTARFLLKGRKLKPVCGDIVGWQTADSGKELILESINERHNQLRRAGHKGAADVLAANLDVLIVVMAAEPTPDFFLTDRYVASAAAMGCEAILVRNKTDIAGKRDEATETELVNYGKLGYGIVPTSTTRLEGIERVSELLAGKTGMLVGQSGVGKSSLINALVPDAAVAVAELSSSSLEGRHTTTASMMHALAADGWLIDSPGVRDFLPYFGDVREVQAGFIEIDQAAHECRFANCQHLREPSCAVKEGVENGNIMERRYESYKRLYHMVEDAQVSP